ncbi:MAG: TMEM175 family protein [Rickettsiales bacterium]|jgi:uncharacterized membrane protein|nr:TMEM175 family protein [Rickettsiales bacterium]
MNKSRLESFSDGVFAIIITIMVLEIEAPHRTDATVLAGMIPIFLSYLLSFIYVAIYWINHHMLVAATRKINNRVLWSNLNLLFWLSLIPFATAWVNENHISSVPVATYGLVLLMCSLSFRMLEIRLFNERDANKVIVGILERGTKEKVSIVMYFLAIGLAFVHPFLSLGIYVGLAGWWFIPNKKLEALLRDHDICDVEK